MTDLGELASPTPEELARPLLTESERHIAEAQHHDEVAARHIRRFHELRESGVLVMPPAGGLFREALGIIYFMAADVRQGQADYSRYQAQVAEEREARLGL